MLFVLKNMGGQHFRLVVVGCLYSLKTQNYQENFVVLPTLEQLAHDCINSENGDYGLCRL